MSEQYQANPIRKVVGMLQDMQKSAEEEGNKEKDLFEAFMCYCSNGASSLDASIATAALRPILSLDRLNHMKQSTRSSNRTLCSTRAIAKRPTKP